MIIQVIIPPIPAELIVIVAGKAYGIFLTTLVGGTGLWVGSILVYYFGRYLHTRFDSFFNRDKVKEIISKIKKYQIPILWIRILPYNPSDTISYAAGIIKFNKVQYITITGITSYTRCFLLAFLGTTITSLQGIFWVIVALAVSAKVAHIILKRK